MANKITIKHTELDIGNGQASYIIITEMVNNIPTLSYHYKIPIEYQMDYAEYEIVEMYYPISPN